MIFVDTVQLHPNCQQKNLHKNRFAKKKIKNCIYKKSYLNFVN